LENDDYTGLHSEEHKPKKPISHTPEYHMYVIGEVWKCPKCKVPICQIYIDYSIKKCTACGWDFEWYHAISVDKIKNVL